MTSTLRIATAGRQRAAARPELGDNPPARSGAHPRASALHSLADSSSPGGWHVLNGMAAELARNPDERLAALLAELSQYVPRPASRQAYAANLPFTGEFIIGCP
jgi:hypothetical protein